MENTGFAGMERASTEGQLLVWAALQGQVWKFNISDFGVEGGCPGTNSKLIQRDDCNGYVVSFNPLPLTL